LFAMSRNACLFPVFTGITTLWKYIVMFPS
jgi:hypothetical protein